MRVKGHVLLPVADDLDASKLALVNADPIAEKEEIGLKGVLVKIITN